MLSRLCVPSMTCFVNDWKRPNSIYHVSMNIILWVMLGKRVGLTICRFFLASFRAAHVVSLKGVFFDNFSTCIFFLTSTYSHFRGTSSWFLRKDLSCSAIASAPSTLHSVLARDVYEHALQGSSDQKGTASLKTWSQVRCNRWSVWGLRHDGSDQIHQRDWKHQ